jgi:hypothetical protein
MVSLPFPEEPDDALEYRLREYLLNPEHKDGKHKLKVFETRFGIGPEDREKCFALLVNASREGEIENVREREDCSTYAIRAAIPDSDGNDYEMRIVWKVPRDTDEVVFISAYPAPPK